MNCSEYQALLTAYLAGEAPSDAEEQLQRHENECPECAALRKAIETAPEELAALVDDIPAMPADLHERWVSEINRQSVAQSRKAGTSRLSLSKRRAVSGILAAAAVLVLLVGSNSLIRSRHPETASNSASGQQLNAALKAQEEPIPSSAPTQIAEPMMANAYGAEPVESFAAEEAAPYEDSMPAMELDEMAEYSERAEMESAPMEEETSDAVIAIKLSITTGTFDECLANLCSNLPDGGWVFDQTVMQMDSGLRIANITLQIPSDSLDEFLDGSVKYGRVNGQESFMNEAEDMGASKSKHASEDTSDSAFYTTVEISLYEDPENH